MATNYSLTVEHNGTDTGDFCVYQTNDNQSEDIRSLVWFSKRAHPNTQLKFRWSLDYGFTWSEQGMLVPGVVFEASQIIPTDLSDVFQNSIGFTKANNAFGFVETTIPTTHGRMGIICDDLIPARTASIGISMSGKSAFACPASPNMKYTFRPHPRYWIAFGKFEEGEVIDHNRMTHKFEVKFRENQFDKIVCLTESNNWLDKSR